MSNMATQKAMASIVERKITATRTKTPHANSPKPLEPVNAPSTAARGTSATPAQLSRSAVSCWWYAQWHHWFTKTQEKNPGTEIPLLVACSR